LANIANKTFTDGNAVPTVGENFASTSQALKSNTAHSARRSKKVIVAILKGVQYSWALFG
jgi:hypothetical protein